MRRFVRAGHLLAVLFTFPLIFAVGCGSGGGGDGGVEPSGEQLIRIPDDAANLVEAVNMAASGDTILMGHGTYTGWGNRGVSLLGKSLVVLAEGSRGVTIDCENSGNAFILDAGEDTTTTFIGLTIVNGESDYGGAVLVDGAGARFIDCTFRDCSAEWNGGGICVTDGDVRVQGCVFDECFSDGYGGGVSCDEGVLAVFDSSFDACEANRGAGVFVDDSALAAEGLTMTNGSSDQYGGGIYCTNASGTMSDCRFEANTAGSRGGGVGIYRSPMMLTHCDFVSNDGSFGGGAFVSGDDVATFDHCSFYDNEVDEDGGGLCVNFTMPVVTHCTFCMNAGPDGGNIFVVSGNPTIQNTIIAYAAEGAGIMCWQDADPTISHCVVFGNAGGDSLCGTPSDNLFVDPSFCDRLSGDLTVTEDSPCLSSNNGWGESVGAYGQGCPAR